MSERERTDEVDWMCGRMSSRVLVERETGPNVDAAREFCGYLGVLPKMECEEPMMGLFCVDRNFRNSKWLVVQQQKDKVKGSCLCLGVDSGVERDGTMA